MISIKKSNQNEFNHIIKKNNTNKKDNKRLRYE